jgi:hypothetical protein
LQTGFFLGVLRALRGGALHAATSCRAAATILALSTLPLSAQAPTGNWNQFRGNARLTGVAESAPPATLSLKWTYDAGDAIDSSPAIADG